MQKRVISGFQVLASHCTSLIHNKFTALQINMEPPNYWVVEENSLPRINFRFYASLWGSAYFNKQTRIDPTYAYTAGRSLHRHA